MKPGKLRAIGIDLGTTNSAVSEIVWDEGSGPLPAQSTGVAPAPGTGSGSGPNDAPASGASAGSDADAPPTIRVLEIEQPTREGVFTSPLVPSVVAILPDGRYIDFPAIRRRVLGLIRGKRDLQNALEFVLVDEGQDLSPEAYEIIHEAARHVTVFADPQQKIFEDGAEAGFIFDRLHVTTPQITILGAFRNAVYVAELAAHFIEDGQKRAQFLAQISAAQRVKERPLGYVADSFDREMDRLAEVVRSRQVMNERIGIIVPTNRLLHGIAEGLAERGVTVEKAATKEKAGKVEVTCSFTNLVPKIATFFMAKGLTFDSVLLPRLTAKAYDWTRREQLRRMMFVGVARATQWVYLSTVKGTEFDEMAVLKEAAAQGHLTMQESGEWRAGADRGGEGEQARGEGSRDTGRREPEKDDFSVL
jgi:hypothetical protein